MSDSVTTSCINVYGERMSGHFSLLYILAQFHHQSHELINIEGVVGELGVVSSHGWMLALRN